MSTQFKPQLKAPTFQSKASTTHRLDIHLPSPQQQQHLNSLGPPQMIKSIGCTRRPLELDNVLPAKRARYSLSTPHSNLKTGSSESPFAGSLRMTPEKMEASIMEETSLRRHRQAKDNTQQQQQQPLFTSSQLRFICERKLKEQQERLRREYEAVLAEKLAEQYDTFIKFTHDEILRNCGPTNRPSYLS